jgi:hypothetical protein
MIFLLTGVMTPFSNLTTKNAQPATAPDHAILATTVALAKLRKKGRKGIRTRAPHADTVGATFQYRYSERFAKEPFMAKGMISAAIETVQRWIGVGKKTVKPGTKQKTKIGPSKFVKKGGKVVKVRR